MGSRTSKILAAAALTLGLALIGCGGDRAPDPSLPLKTIYVNAPQHGPLGLQGQEVSSSVKLALEKTYFDTSEARLRLIVLDTAVSSGNRYEHGRAVTVKDSPARAVANARRAIQDRSAVAIIGQLTAESAAAVAEVTGPAGLLQLDMTPAVRNIRPVGRRQSNVIRLLPTLEDQGAAVAQQVAREPRRVIFMADSSQEFRRSVSAGMRGPLALIPASRSRGTARPPYVIDDQSAVRLPGNATVITPALAEADLPPSGKSFYKDFERKHSRPPNRFAIFAYEATGLAVEAVERAGKGQISMRSVTGAAFGIHNRHGTIGHYDILPNGQSTLYVFATRHLRDDDIPEIPADLIEVQP